MNIGTLLLVFAGGAAGSVLRWGTGVALGHRYQGQFPLATFLINVSGAFLIGAFPHSSAWSGIIGTKATWPH